MYRNTNSKELPSLTRESNKFALNKLPYNSAHKLTPLYKEKSLLACPSDDESCTNEVSVKARPPLHPLRQERIFSNHPTENTLIKQFTSSGKGVSKRVESSVVTINPSLNSAVANNDLMSILIDKVVAKNVKDTIQTEKSPLEPPLESPAKTDNYFDDKLLKFKLIKVRNIFAPTYKMSRQEGEKIRHQIKMEAMNEMDKIISDTVNTSSKNIRERHSRQVTIRRNREGSSDSTSDRSGSLAPVSARRQTALKNKIIRIKAKRNTKGLMNKLNVIRDNMYKKKMPQNSNNSS